MEKTLYNQLETNQLNLDCLALICNTESTNRGFTIDLQDTPAIPEPFTLGQAALAYLKTVAAKFEDQADSQDDDDDDCDGDDGDDCDDCDGEERLRLMESGF